MVIYGQRTAHDRIAFCGRGAPYHFASRIRPEYDRHARVHRRLLPDTLRRLFAPFARDGVPVAAEWGGPLGAPRDWSCSVGFDRTTGEAWAGGYVGDGVATSNLAGRTLADLILGRDTDLVHLPWVGHRSPQWEPEPLRWIGINAGLHLADSADRFEQGHGRPSRWRQRAMGLLLGR
jgi:glycine/D-amino acid oxidase-like deaminating enzyme